MAAPGREAVDPAAQPAAAVRATHAAVAVAIRVVRVVRGFVNVSVFLVLSAARVTVASSAQGRPFDSLGPT